MAVVDSVVLILQKQVRLQLRFVSEWTVNIDEAGTDEERQVLEVVQMNAELHWRHHEVNITHISLGKAEIVIVTVG